MLRERSLARFGARATFLAVAAALALNSCAGRGSGAVSPLPGTQSAATQGRAATSLASSTATPPPNKMPDSPPLATTSAMNFGPPCRPAVDVSPGGYSSCNVEWIAHIALHGGETIGGHFVPEKHVYYVTNWETGEYAFDTSSPEHPALLGNLAVSLGKLPAGALISEVENEDTATNGKVLILSRSQNNDAVVLNVHDPRNMSILATVPNGPGHTQNCLYNCAWNYGSTTGTIMDLRDPAHPVLESNKWSDTIMSTPPNPNPVGNAAHDLTEIRPGLLAVANNPVTFLDTTNPAHPTKLFSLSATPAEPKPGAMGPAQAGHVGHSVGWPRSGADRFFLGQSEGIYVGRCENFPNDGRTLYSYDTTGWQSRRDFSLVGAYTLVMGNALPGTGGISGVDANGNPSTIAVGAPEGCSVHWFDVNNRFHNGGLVALSAFAFGVRLLNVASNGQIQQIGWFVPSGIADTVAVHWITDRILYVLDFETGGMDVIKYTGPLPASGPLNPRPPSG